MLLPPVQDDSPTLRLQSGVALPIRQDPVAIVISVRSARIFLLTKE